MKSIPERKTPILIVDDDTGFLLTIKEVLVSAGMPEPALVSDSREVMALLREYRFKFVLLDLLMPHLSGMDLLTRIKSEFYDTECVMVTASDDIATAVSAMKDGAYDYLTKPVQYEKLVILIQRALERYCLRQGLSLYERKNTRGDLTDPSAFSDMVATDHAIIRVLRQVEMVAPTEYSVVITGESGTGKEMLARKIHELSNRSEGPFVALNMGAVSETLFTDELFGHTKGAYTGAAKERQGFFESAGGGTLFLDEITDLDITLQAGLLRVIQEKEYYRVGSTRSRDVDVRILVATNRDIFEEIKQKRFREDLFHRLNMFHIDIPPLRERRGDILPLAHLFLTQYTKETMKQITKISPDFSDYLMAQDYPGNIRELKNIIASAVLREKTDTLTLKSLGGTSQPDISQSADNLGEDRSLWRLDQVEKEHILAVLAKTGDNRTRAAKILGIGRKTLLRKLKSYASAANAADTEI
ncbi:MAG: sigma-54 dependent transcriptional regulator [Desulfobacterales bacterium]|nr:sigma-54 dependent transcriptional regulator [Desulfobacterales bacterium]